MPIIWRSSIYLHSRLPGTGEPTAGSKGTSLPDFRSAARILLVSIVLAGCAAPGSERATSLCPDTPEDIPVDPDGCPLDTDIDGVADDSDACPGTPIGVRVNARGCPLAGERIAIVTNINFDSNRANVRGNVQERLDRVIQLLKEMPDVDVQIVGYTDNIGSAAYNLELSLRRAESVRDYIVERGIHYARLSVAGRGKTQPLVSNSTPEGRAVNRRVEFVVR